MTTGQVRKDKYTLNKIRFAQFPYCLSLFPNDAPAIPKRENESKNEWFFPGKIAFENCFMAEINRYLCAAIQQFNQTEFYIKQECLKD
jgi:hypothetical protein